MRALHLLAFLPALLVCIAAAPPPKPAVPADEAPQPIVAAIPAGPFKDAVRKIFLKPYAQATGTELGDPGWNGSADTLKSLQAAHGADLALLDGPSLAASCRAQTIEKLDWAGVGRDRFLPLAVSDCGVGAYVSSTIIAWDRDKLPGTPSWGDFWDVAKHPGRRGLRRGARGNLEIALLADGVSPGDIYRTLRSADGVDRAFRKLDQLKPYIVWWDQPSQPVQLLSSAKVLLTSTPAGAAPLPPAQRTPAHAGTPAIGTQWAGCLAEIASWAVLANAPHVRGAMAAILIATDTARQAEFDRATGQGPTNTAALALLPTDLRAQSPSLPANLQAGLVIDEAFWLDNGPKLEARFAAWVGN